MNSKAACLLLLVAIPLTHMALPQRSSIQQASAISGPRYVPADVDNDGRVDAFVIEASGRGRLLVQDRNGSFVDRTAECGLDAAGAVDQAYWKDLTNDRWQDLIVLRPDGRLGLFIGDGQAFSELTSALEATSGLGVSAVAFEDYDLNGWFDLGLWTVDGSMKVAVNLGDLVFELRDGGPWTFGASGLSLIPAGPGGQLTLQAGSLGGGSASLASGGCTPGITDQVTANCLYASTTPALGRLYPLSSDLFVQNGSGNVGINNTNPTERLEVAGVIRTTGGMHLANGSDVQLSAGGEIRFSDNSTMNTAMVAGPAGAPGPAGPEGPSGTVLPAGTILMSGRSEAPDGFVLCDGTFYDWDDYPELRDAIQTTYGGTIGVQYRVPDLTQRFPMGAENTPGYVLGQNGGSLDHTHHVPANSHDHGLNNHVHSLNSHTHTVPGHWHDVRASGGTINVSSASSEHRHELSTRTGAGPASLDANRVARGSTDFPANGTGQTMLDGAHAHPNTSFSGTVGNANSGVPGDGNFSTQSPSVTDTLGPSTSETLNSDAFNTQEANPPFVTVHFIIKT